MRRTRILWLAALALMAACSESSTAPERRAPPGRYDLRLVDGGTLPYLLTFANAPYPGWYTRGSLTVSADGTYTQTLSDSTRDFGTGVVQEAGTWDATGDSLTFMHTSSATSARFARDTIARREFGRVLVFVRR